MSRLSMSAPLEQSQANTGRSRARSKGPGPAQPSKRLVVCADGTWLNSDSGNLKGSIAIPSNVTRISRCIKPISRDGIPQIVSYHYGVGGGSGALARLQGFTGDGIAEIIRECYQFIATNWVPGDEIFIFGFSRGAYTARSVAGLINQIGILTNEGLPYFAEIFRDVKNQHNSNYLPKNPDIPFPNKPSFLDPEYVERLQSRRMAILDVPVKVVGVWDTVGALGIPKVGWLTRLGLQSSTMKELSFYDTSLGNCIENAFQALALDERRFSFQPTLWEKLEGNTTNLRQVWFPGAHSNIGGGYDDQQIATISLAWMVAQCQQYLDFDEDYVVEEWEKVEDFYEEHEKRVRPWSFGRLWDGIASVYVFGGVAIRKPGRYCATDPTNGRETQEPLIDTREYIHPCVRARVKLKGPGIDDDGRYECKSLRDWKLVIENEEGGNRPRIGWLARDKPEPDFERRLPEAPLKQLEMQLLNFDKETAEYVLRPSGVRQRRSKRDSSRMPSRAPSQAPSRAPSRGPSRKHKR
jgi:uncharacterized protein (DUF2235 family)